MQRYEHKQLAIIGGTSGMGLATARLLRDEGARVLVTGRTAAHAAEAQRELGDDVIVVQSDASRIGDVDALAATIRETFGGLDALFISAGISHAGSVQDATAQAFDDVFDINTKGAYFTLQRLAPLMREGAGVVLATSVSNVKGLPNTSIYAASKAALRSMARTFARELLDQGVRVNAVSPGPIDTGILDRSMPAEAVEALKVRMIANNPMGRFGSPEEIARAVAFLALDATFTTGAELAVDGGVSQLL
jgi:NAD(P)-dependent dehydrogenase (short-subunit alcohol dehydrogenase family)